jgi:hypothetical protein
MVTLISIIILKKEKLNVLTILDTTQKFDSNIYELE